MIFYEFNKPGTEPIKQNSVIGGVDDITFFDVQDNINVKDTYLPFPGEMTKLALDSARMLRKGKFTIYTENGEKIKPEMTEEEKVLGLETRKIIKIIKLRKYYQDLIENTFPILSNEKSSWERQKTEADLYTLDNTASVAFISTLANTRGITLDELVAKILEKAEAYALFIAGTIGTQHKQEEDIEACTTLEELDIVQEDLPDFCMFYFDR